MASALAKGTATDETLAPRPLFAEGSRQRRSSTYQTPRRLPVQLCRPRPPCSASNRQIWLESTGVAAKGRRSSRWRKRRARGAGRGRGGGRTR